MDIVKRELSSDRSLVFDETSFEEFFEIVEGVVEHTPVGRPKIDADYVPKKSTKVRLDADVINWLRSRGPKHYSRINAILRVLAIMDPEFEFLDYE